jgi:hypothetical protein
LYLRPIHIVFSSICAEGKKLLLPVVPVFALLIVHELELPSYVSQLESAPVHAMIVPFGNLSRAAVARSLFIGPGAEQLPSAKAAAAREFRGISSVTRKGLLLTIPPTTMRKSAPKNAKVVSAAHMQHFL